MRRRTAAGVAATTLITLMALAGCNAAPDSGSGDSSANGGEEAAGSADMAENAEAAPGDDAAGVIDQAVLSAPQRHVIHSVELSVRTDDVQRAARAATDVATRAGGFVADEHTAGNHSATLTLRVPADGHDDAVARLEELGEVVDRSRSAEDVTQEVVDTESRITSQRASIARIRTLLDEAGELSDVITVEGELAEREADLDALLTRQDQLAGLTTMATINVSFQRDGAEPPDDDDRGFLAGLSGGWDAFVSAGAVALTVLGAILPFAVVVAAVGYPAYVVIRRHRARPRNAAPAPQPDAPAA